MGQDEIATDLAVRGDGSVIVIGTKANFTFLSSWGVNGSSDTSFNNGNSWRQFDLSPNYELPRQITALPDGKLLFTAEYANAWNEREFLVGRLNSNGLLDDGSSADITTVDSFGVGGLANISFDGLGTNTNSQSTSFVLDSSGIVLTGTPLVDHVSILPRSRKTGASLQQPSRLPRQATIPHRM